MALQMDVETEGGLSAPDAYIRVVPLRFTKDVEGDWTVRVRFEVFKDSATAETNGYPLAVDFNEVSTLSYPLTATGNVLKWVYSALKKLPEFDNAVDV